MTNVDAFRWLLGAAAFGVVVFALHHLFLWMESKGWLYYWHRQPEGSRWSAIIELQKAVEPQARHVVEHKLDNPLRVESPASGADPQNSDDASAARSGGTS